VRNCGFGESLLTSWDTPRRYAFAEMLFNVSDLAMEGNREGDGAGAPVA